MPQTKLHELSEFGQSIWLDYINRSLLDSGHLKELIDAGLRGMTSNPTIFHQAISLCNDYDSKIIKMKSSGKSIFEIYDELTTKDIQDACDGFKGVYQTTKGLDGYVSLEINPKMANDTAASILEGERLFKKVNRPNLMIKVPATPQGYKVVEELLSQGINVNVTLIFSLRQYEQTVQAFLNGLNRLSQNKGDLSKVVSVASVFVSRTDSTIDKMLDERMAKASDEKEKARLKALKGKAAVCNCKLIFEKSKELFGSEAFSALKKQKASVQRVLWASTSTKNPDYPDIKYITELISKPTVNTLPEKTIQAFIDHGQVKEALTENLAQTQAHFKSLKVLGIDIDQVCAKLLDDGVVSFQKSFEELLQSIETKAQQLSVKV